MDGNIADLYSTKGIIFVIPKDDGTYIFYPYVAEYAEAFFELQEVIKEQISYKKSSGAV